MLFFDESRFMLSRNDGNDVADVRESTTLQPLLSLGELLVVAVLQCEQGSPVGTELPYTLLMVQ